MAAAIVAWRSRATRRSAIPEDDSVDMVAEICRAIKARGFETEMTVPIMVLIDLEMRTSAVVAVEHAELTTNVMGRKTENIGFESVIAELIDVSNLRIYVRSMLADSMANEIAVWKSRETKTSAVAAVDRLLEINAETDRVIGRLMA